LDANRVPGGVIFPACLGKTAVLNHRGGQVLPQPSFLAEVDDERNEEHKKEAGHDYRDVIGGGHGLRHSGIPPSEPGIAPLAA
jgi:hypothetical protein